MTAVPTLDDVDLTGKRVLMRVDCNVPLHDGRIDDDARIRACLPGIRRVLRSAARLILVSHLGRPEEGVFAPEYSLRPVAARLAELLGRPARLCRNWHSELAAGKQPAAEADAVVMLENIRFEKGETSDGDSLARELAALCDVYVNDAFAAAHRAHASTHGIARHAPAACAGPLLTAELAALSTALRAPARPMLAIVGGGKVSSKLTALENLLRKVDALILGGGIANTFLLAAGHNIGRSLAETALLPTAQKLLREDERRNKILLPVDVVCAKERAADAAAAAKPLREIAADDLILDIGPRTAALYAERIAAAATIVWNGPLGVFELPPFAAGTRALAEAIADADGFSIAGGGDTLSAIARFGVRERISRISTGGGAFLAWLEGKPLPAVDILRTRR